MISNSYIRDTRQLILPDTSRPVLDLFACETAALLSTVYYLLREQLDDVSELICKNIFDLIESRLVRPYLEDQFWWMGNGNEPMCNWTPWCTQNVLLSVFLLPFNDDIRFKAAVTKVHNTTGMQDSVYFTVLIFLIPLQIMLSGIFFPYQR